MRVVLDSNILFSGLISPHTPPHRIYQAWQRGVFELVTCNQQLEEIRRASRYPKFKHLLQPHLVGVMVNNMKKNVFSVDLSSDYTASDPDDIWLLALADKTQAHYLVTGDKRAGILSQKTIGHTQIVTASVFCKIIL